jgi:CheY-like chemotaxis protein
LPAPSRAASLLIPRKCPQRGGTTAPGWPLKILAEDDAIVRFEALPIIALTANAFPDDIKQCRDAGMSDFLAKPLRKPAMVAAILRATTPAVAASPELVA